MREKTGFMEENPGKKKIHAGEKRNCKRIMQGLLQDSCGNFPTTRGKIDAATFEICIFTEKYMATFYDFICSMPVQEDVATNKFVSMCKIDDDFPRNNDPAKLAIHLYLKLDPKLTSTFQKLMMLYNHAHPGQFPKRAFAREDMALTTLNLIVSLQNASVEYKWN